MAGGRILIGIDPDLTGFPGKLRTGLAGSVGAASAAGSLISRAITIGAAAAAFGLKKVIDVGVDYQNSMNTLQAVTGATGSQMSRVGTLAKQLGADMSLPATSAVDAAEAMTELAKGGLSVEQAMSAAKGTLQLAAAAQIDAGQAAQFQSAALNAFGLSADQAGRVADVLANSANAAAGEITDFAQAMQQVGTVANSLGISLEDTATALSLLANAGIKGSDAGTLLKTALIQLASPSKQAAAALRTLGVDAFDAQGKFVGLDTIFGELQSASQRLTPEMYAQAAATAFGTDAARIAGVAAGLTADQWDKMSASIRRQGGAADVAAAKTKGLGGAFEALKSQAETAALGIFDAIDGPAESLVRGLAESIPRVQQFITELADGTNQTLKPFGEALGNIADGVRPVVAGIGDVVSELTSGQGALSSAGAALGVLGHGIELITRAASPLGSLIGGIASAFASLPGPVQTAVLALGAYKAVSSLLGRSKSDAEGATRAQGLLGSAMRTATAPARLFGAAVAGSGSALKQFAAEARLQSSLATAAGSSIGRLGAAQAAFETSTLRSVSAVRAFRDQLRSIEAGALAIGQPISRADAALRALADRSPTVAAMRTAFITASTAVTEFGDRAAAAAGKAAEGFGGKIASSAAQAVAAVRALPAAAGAAGSALGERLRVGAAAAGDALSRLGARTTQFGQALGSRVTAGVTAVGAAVTRLPGIIGTAVGSLDQIPARIQTGISALGRFGGVVAGVGASIGTGLVRGVGGLMEALGGPWGLALTAGAAALSIFAGKQQEAAAAAQAHQAAVDGLAGTLDKLSGATTAATAAEVARLIATERLSDGTTTVAQAVRDAGISVRDFTAAAQGNAPALERVNAQLRASARPLVESSQIYGAWKKRLDEAGISLDTVTEAALGNQAAVGELQSKLGGLPGLSTLIGNLHDAAGGFAELAGKLGGYNDNLKQAQDQTEAAAAATATFEDRLKLISTAFGGLRDGGPVTKELSENFRGLAGDATAVAKAAGDAAASVGGVGSGAAAAADSMQKSREAFVSAATAAGLTADQAAKLADQIGLIPAAARTQFETNADAITGQILTLREQFAAIPGTKTITVNSLTADAEAAVTDLGFTVEHLPNGQINVTVVGDGDAAAKLAAAAKERTAKITAQPSTAAAEAALNSTARARNSIVTGQASVNVAEQSINNVARNRTSTITVRTVYVGGLPVGQGPRAGGGAIGGIFAAGFAKGGLAQARAYAGGALAGMRLRPMSSRIADIIPPNTPRIIGDRITDDEAFVPVNRSPRSLAIFEELARRLGYSAVRLFQDGGIGSGSGFDTGQFRHLAALQQGRSTAMGISLSRLMDRLAPAAPVGADVFAAAVREAVHTALHGARLEISGSGVARLVNRQNVLDRRLGAGARI